MFGTNPLCIIDVTISSAYNYSVTNKAFVKSVKWRRNRSLTYHSLGYERHFWVVRIFDCERKSNIYVIHVDVCINCFLRSLSKTF